MTSLDDMINYHCNYKKLPKKNKEIAIIPNPLHK